MAATGEIGTLQPPIPVDLAVLERSSNLSVRTWLLKQLELNICLGGISHLKGLGYNYLGQLLYNPDIPKRFARLSNCLDDISATEWEELLKAPTINTFLDAVLKPMLDGEEELSECGLSSDNWSKDKELELDLAQIKKAVHFYFGDIEIEETLGDPEDSIPEYVDAVYQRYLENVDYIPMIFEGYCSFFIKCDEDETYPIFGTLDPDQILSTHIRSCFSYGTVEQAVTLLKQLDSGYDASPTFALMISIWAGRTDIFEACIREVGLQDFAEEWPKLVGATTKMLPFVEVVCRVWPNQLELLFSLEVLTALIVKGDFASLVHLVRVGGRRLFTEELKAKAGAIAYGNDFGDLARLFSSV